MRRRTFLSTALLVPLSLRSRESEATLAVDSTPPNGALALLNARLIDGTGGAPVLDGAVLVRDGRIAAVEASSTLDIPPDAQVHDLNGATVLPGFVNTHVHAAFNEYRLRAWAHDGVTTVRDLGADPRRPLFALRDGYAADPGCARLVAAGPMVTVRGGYPMVPWGSPSGLPVTSIADAREQVGRLLDNGADLIKVAVESGSSFGRTIPTLSLGQLRAVVEVAHERGSRVSAHVLTSEDLERALDGGVDDIAHMVTDLLPDRLVRRMVKTQTTWVPTLELWHGVRPDLGQVAISNLAKFVRAGGRVALGTDYAGYSSLFDLGMPLREIAWMEQAGMEPMAIIVAATREAARVCNAESRFGTLEVGKGADLLVAQGDPLADLRALQSVHMVIQRGSIIRGA